MNRQSKPMLSKSSIRRGAGTPDWHWHRIIILVLGLFICLMFWANLQLIESPTSNNRSSSSFRALGQFTFPKYPVASKIGKKLENPSPEIEAWNTWAEEPMTGSYKFDDKIRIHHPFMDLQSYYHDVRPDFSQFSHFGVTKSASASVSLQPLKLTNAEFPESDGVVLTRKGNKFAASGVKYNQDRVILVTFGETDWWIGLFDGHGYHGHVTSQYCSMEFAKQLIQQQSQIVSDKNPTDIVETIFNNIQLSMPVIPEAGTTGISILKRNKQLYISNIGDSKAFVASFDPQNPTISSSIKMLYETKAHKPDLPEERARIESMGGTVLDAPMPGESARLLIPNVENPDMSMALAMSRSLGDQDGTRYGLSSEPTTDILDLESLDKSREYFVVAASDGLLDHASQQKVAIDFASALSSSNPLETAEKLILESSHGWAMLPIGGYRDDISVAMHRIRL